MYGVQRGRTSLRVSEESRAPLCSTRMSTSRKDGIHFWNKLLAIPGCQDESLKTKLRRVALAKKRDTPVLNRHEVAESSTKISLYVQKEHISKKMSNGSDEKSDNFSETIGDAFMPLIADAIWFPSYKWSNWVANWRKLSPVAAVSMKPPRDKHTNEIWIQNSRNIHVSATKDA